MRVTGFLLLFARKFSYLLYGYTINNKEGVTQMNENNQLLKHPGLPEVLPTDEAAAAINRRPQTLRKWACLENGPIRPIRINGRLAWLVSDLHSLLSGGAA